MRKIWTAGEEVTADELNAMFKFGGDGSDGELDISSGTTTIDAEGAQVIIKNYTSVSITGTAKLTISNPHANGTVLYIKVQGDCTISSTQPGIDMSGMGAAATGQQITPADGQDGNYGYCGITKTNRGTGARTGPTVGTGGATGLFYPLLLSNKYPQISVGASGGNGVLLTQGGGSYTGPSGAGGGGLIIECGGDLDFTGTLSVAGGNGGTANINGGGSGGGGGGSCIIVYESATATSGTITTSGGTGGNNDANAGNNRAGGGGGGSGINAGVNGTTSTGASAKTGGNGGDGYSIITQNTEY